MAVLKESKHVLPDISDTCGELGEFKERHPYRSSV